MNNEDILMGFLRGGASRASERGDDDADFFSGIVSFRAPPPVIYLGGPQQPAHDNHQEMARNHDA